MLCQSSFHEQIRKARRHGKGSVITFIDSELITDDNDRLMIEPWLASIEVVFGSP